MRNLNLRRPTPTTFIAVTALVLSTTGTSYAAVQMAAKNSVKSSAIVNGTIKTADLGLGSVSAAKLGTASVTGLSLADASVATTKLADGSVTTPKVADGAITTPKLADNAVTTPKLADGSVSKAKLALDAKPIFAVVTGSTGVLNRGSAHVAGSARTAEGRYTVTFDREVTGCAYIATLGGITDALYKGVISAAQKLGDPKSVNVLSSDLTGTDINHSFHLSVVC